MSAPGIGQVQDYLRETIGLDADSIGRGAVDRAAERRMASEGCATADAWAPSSAATP